MSETKLRKLWACWGQVQAPQLVQLGGVYDSTKPEFKRTFFLKLPIFYLWLFFLPLILFSCRRSSFGLLHVLFSIVLLYSNVKTLIWSEKNDRRSIFFIFLTVFSQKIQILIGVFWLQNWPFWSIKILNFDRYLCWGGVLRRWWFSESAGKVRTKVGC